jgi:ABC-2 type transport system ATP-binding protein
MVYGEPSMSNFPRRKSWFLGPNGAGKTTTMRILCGYMPPTSGMAKVAGFDIVDQSLDVRKRVGYMPETVPLYPDMSVFDYLKFMADYVTCRAEERVEKWRVVHMTDRGEPDQQLQRHAAKD